MISPLLDMDLTLYNFLSNNLIRSSLYLQSEFDQCTSNWLKFLLTELKRDASTLEECRLTPYDVPVIGEQLEMAYFDRSNYS